MNKLTRYSRNLGLTAGILLCAGIATTPAVASSIPITFIFTGTVTKVGYEMSTDFGGPFRLGQSATGTYTFNPGTLNTGSDSSGEYKGALNGSSTNLHVTIGTYVVSLGAGDNTIEVKNPDNFNHESYEVEGRFSGSTVTGHDPKSFELELEHPYSDQFINVSLPLTPPTLSAFREKIFRLEFAHEQSPDRHRVIVTLETLTPVPLPPAVILFGAGLVALIGLGARNRQRGQKIGVLGSKL